MLSSSEEFDTSNSSNPIPKLPERPRVLIVDDDSILLSTLSRVLSNAPRKYNIGMAASAEDALAIIRAIHVDVLVTDLKLPEMDGLSLASAVRKLSPDTGIILMTAYGSYDLVNTAHREGCVSYLEKPFDLNQLVRHVEFAIEGAPEDCTELGELKMQEIIQLYAEREKNIALNVNSSENSGLVVIENGIISHAQFGTNKGPEALSAILSCNEAVVTSLRCEVRGERTLSLSPDCLQDFKSKEQAKSGSIEDVLNIVLSAANKPVADSAQDENSAELKFPIWLRSVKDLPPGIPPELRTYSSTLQRGFSKKLDERALIREKQSKLVDFKPEDLVLKPEPEPEPVVEILIGREKREAAVQKFLQQGIKHFRDKNYDKAREAWDFALRNDPECEAAKNNLRVLDHIVGVKEE